ncbi:portal protein [Romboutsia sp.]|uniref:portal protein n=1 Tax=Romboutsia sp. TaxID=1965302 RepID=UPI002BAD63BE|nr:hypothetical protein [Romboutsia sp.]HSQ90149.1 hypothetical protein [Romboutsia sp.]
MGKPYTPTPQEQKLCEWANTKFKQSYVAKAPIMEEWKTYESAYNGEHFKNESRPDYKSNQITNHIFSTIESIRPIMTDNDPKFLTIPTTPDGNAVASDIQVALDYEWNREAMSLKLTTQLLPMLIYGTCCWFIPWDAKKGDMGEVSCKAVNPFNIFPDPLAQNVEDAEYIIYATYKHANQLKKAFPDKADAFVGSNITHSELVADRDKDAIGEQNQILVLEMWFRDWATVEEIEDEKGNKAKMQKYPNGRVLTCCPDIGVVLSDKKNPYKDGKFPFLFMKDYEVPFEFWGKGEVEQILSPQIYMNELTNQIIDNAKSTANMPWIIDKNCGISPGKLTNRPGLVIRKNPGTEVGRPTPPSMPVYVRDSIEVMKKDIQDVSGVFDSLKGEKQSGVVAAQAIMALQEASQARIRLKIKIMEFYLGELATMWYSRMQQFWKFNKWVRVTDIENNVEFKEITPEILKNDFDIRISAGSTMPTNKNAQLDLLIRLAQTTAEDGMPMVDRKAILDFLPNVDKKAIINRFDEMKAMQQQEAQAQQQQQAQMQQAQQVGEQQVQTIQESLQGLSQAIQMINKQVDELVADKENKEQQGKEEEIENKGYERGIKETEQAMKQPVNDEQEIPQEEMIPNEEQVEMTPEQIDADPNVNTGQLPIQALQELQQMSPEELQALIQEYPELLEMLKSDMGGAMNG